MKIQCDAMKLELRIRGDPAPKGKLLEFVRKRARKHEAKQEQLEVSTQHNYKSYSRSY